MNSKIIIKTSLFVLIRIIFSQKRKKNEEQMNATATKFDANFSGIKMHKTTLPWDCTKKNDDAKNALNLQMFEKDLDQLQFQTTNYESSTIRSRQPGNDDSSI